MISGKQVKELFGPIIIIFVLLFSFLIRNLITSGFLLYPGTFPDIVTQKWKTGKHETNLQASYVTTYARIESDFSQKAIAETKKMKIGRWLPIWWHERNIPDKVILLLLLPALIFLPSYIIIKRRNLTRIQVVCILTSLTGVIFWFIMAPHPRFGFGFILAAIGITANIYFQNVSFKTKEEIIFMILLLGNMTIAGYIIYREQYFFSEKQIIKPLGVQPIPYSSVKMKNITLKFPRSSSTGCGTIPLPCIDSSETEASPIGNEIEDGFFSQKNDH
jgi:hypothetical protein